MSVKKDSDSAGATKVVVTQGGQTTIELNSSNASTVYVQNVDDPGGRSSKVLGIWIYNDTSATTAADVAQTDGEVSIAGGDNHPFPTPSLNDSFPSAFIIFNDAGPDVKVWES